MIVKLIKLASLIITLNKAMACADRVAGVLDIQTSMHYPEASSPAKDASANEVEFDKVSFAYAGAGASSLSNISFSVKKGETVGIIGGTVRENICFGKPDASDEEIIRAAKEAKSWDFIRRLPLGLDTVLHEDSISQGQKQLLCITRVMLCLPPMLILDEATSSIDTRTELQVQEAFDKLMKGRTSFVVAHRLSTIRNACCVVLRCPLP